MWHLTQMYDKRLTGLEHVECHGGNGTVATASDFPVANSKQQYTRTAHVNAKQQQEY